MFLYIPNIYTKMSLQIICKDNSDISFSLSKQQSLELEIKLNISEYGKLWVKIGDHLYKYYINNNYNNKLVVSKKQYNYLLKLYNKN